MAQQIQLRNDTAANWTSSNPTLALGELGLETDTSKFKVGTGGAAWASLAYGGIQGANGSQVTAGTGAPSNGNGSNGDFYFRTDTNHFYTKAAGTWSDGGLYIGTIPTTLGGTGFTTYTTGDLIYSSASNTLSKLAIGTGGQSLQVVSGIPAWADKFDPSKEFFLFEDFQTGNPAAMATGMTTSGSAGGAASNIALADNTHIGVYEIQTGTSNANDGSYLGWSTTNHCMIFSNGEAKFEAVYRLSRLSTGAQEYRMRIGWYDDTSQTDSTTDGAYVYYDRAATGDFYVIRTANNGTITSTTTTEPVLATTWTKLTIIVNAAGTLATFYINGVSIGTISTNIPIGATRGTGCMFGIHKTVGTGTDSTIAMDYLFQRKIFTTPR